jgi:hypothetical protein
VGLCGDVVQHVLQLWGSEALRLGHRCILKRRLPLGH